jgi:hypothetical protein
MVNVIGSTYEVAYDPGQNSMGRTPPRDGVEVVIGRH